MMKCAQLTEVTVDSRKEASSKTTPRIQCPARMHYILAEWLVLEEGNASYWNPSKQELLLKNVSIPSGCE
ncbi:MAG: hypothetical protein C4K47_02700 [Candidatus Thorarchaeota archaeon]|nr:MAG: hypothetical protein C4K47_02700 [Candidatus Thorarchaeota archaeon]